MGPADVEEPGCDQAAVVLVQEDLIDLKLIAFEEKTIGQALVGYKNVEDDEKEKEDGRAHGYSCCRLKYKYKNRMKLIYPLMLLFYVSGYSQVAALKD